MKLKLENFLVKPQIDRTNLNTITCKAGLSVSLDVKVIGEPVPEIVWKVQGSELSNNEITVTNIDYNTKLFIEKSKRIHSGIYTILATNSVGQDSADVEILITSKPSTPKGPLKISDVTQNGCHLQWDIPDDDGGCPIENYEVEKLDPLTGQWIPCAKSKTPEVNVTGLLKGKSYSFRVKAVNKEGESDSLVADQSIIAKNPYGKFFL